MNFHFNVCVFAFLFSSCLVSSIKVLKYLRLLEQVALCASHSNLWWLILLAWGCYDLTKGIGMIFTLSEEPHTSENITMQNISQHEISCNILTFRCWWLSNATQMLSWTKMEENHSKNFQWLTSLASDWGSWKMFIIFSNKKRLKIHTEWMTK